ncbi:MAG: VWA domain-containing protein, partial [Cyclobacteriaceae bacterium]
MPETTIVRRTSGFTIGPNEEAEALTALTLRPSRDQEEFMQILRIVLAKNRKEWLNFESLFITYWSELDKAVNSKKKDVSKNVLQRKSRTASFASLKNWLYRNQSDSDKKEELAAWSNLESLARKDFSAYNPDDVEQIKKILRQLKKSLTLKKRRRYRSTRKRRKLDLRRTIRKNIRQGSDIIELLHRSRQNERMRLLVICD